MLTHTYTNEMPYFGQVPSQRLMPTVELTRGVSPGKIQNLLQREGARCYADHRPVSISLKIYESMIILKGRGEQK